MVNSSSSVAVDWRCHDSQQMWADEAEESLRPTVTTWIEQQWPNIRTDVVAWITELAKRSYRNWSNQAAQVTSEGANPTGGQGDGTTALVRRQRQHTDRIHFHTRIDLDLRGALFLLDLVSNDDVSSLASMSSRDSPVLFCFLFAHCPPRDPVVMSWCPNAVQRIKPMVTTDGGKNEIVTDNVIALTAARILIKLESLGTKETIMQHAIRWENAQLVTLHRTWSDAGTGTQR